MQIENVTKTLFTKQLSLSITYAWKGFDKKTGRKYGLLYRESRHPTHLFFTANKYNYSSCLFHNYSFTTGFGQKGIFHISVQSMQNTASYLE